MARASASTGPPTVSGSSLCASAPRLWAARSSSCIRRPVARSCASRFRSRQSLMPPQRKELTRVPDSRVTENEAITVVLAHDHSLVRRGFRRILEDDLAAAVKRAAAGETVLDSSVTRPRTLKGEREEGLTAREVEVLQLICDGYSNREIAATLDLSVNTVAVHRANIMNRLGVHK